MVYFAFSLFFYILKEFKHCFPAFFDSDLQVRVGCFKKIRVELEHELVHVFAAQLPHVLLKKNLLVLFCEFHGVERQFRVSEVNEKNHLCFLLLLWELVHFVKAVVDSYRSRFVDQGVSVALLLTFPCDVDRIKESLSLIVGQIVWNSND